VALLGLIAALPVHAGTIETYAFIDTTGVIRASLSFDSPPAQSDAAWQTTTPGDVASLTIIGDQVFGTQVYENPFGLPQPSEKFGVASINGTLLDGQVDGLEWLIGYSPLNGLPVTSNGSTSLEGFVADQNGLTYQLASDTESPLPLNFVGKWSLVPEPSGWIMATIGGGIMLSVTQLRLRLKSNHDKP